MIPGSRSIRVLTMLGVIAVLAPFFPELVFLLTLIAAGLVGIAIFEAMQLRRITVSVDRPERVALSLDELEKYPLRVSTTAPFPTLLKLRQVWPALVEQKSSSREGICRPGEVVPFEFSLHAIARGITSLEPASVRLT